MLTPLLLVLAQMPSDHPATGGKADIRAPMDMGWLYNRTFEDPDGHVFEAVSVDMAAMPAEMKG